MVNKFLALLGLLLCTLPFQTTPSKAASDYRIVGYYTSWSLYGSQYFVSDIPAAKLTHINYAFVNISETGECILGDKWADSQAGDPPGNLAQLVALRAEHPHLKLLFSIGGWTWSSRFSGVALTPESRAHFAASCVALLRQYQFDGLDVDWEFPVEGGLKDGIPADKVNFTLLLAELRNQLNQQGEADNASYLLTIAAPQTATFYKNIEIDQIHPYLDWINVMTYTFHGGWSDLTNHHAPLFPSPADPNTDPMIREQFNAAAALQAYVEAGVPPEKLVMGVPFYGQGWGGVPNVNQGLYQPYSSLPSATWGNGIYDYADLKAHYLPIYPRYWDDHAQAAWLYDPTSQTMISYEDAQSLAAKADYVKTQGLGGIMIWELGYDDDEQTLLTSLANALLGNG